MLFAYTANVCTIRYQVYTGQACLEFNELLETTYTLKSLFNALYAVCTAVTYYFKNYNKNLFRAYYINAVQKHLCEVCKKSNGGSN